MKQLKDILQKVSGYKVIGYDDVMVSSVCLDSRDVKQNSAFVAVSGTQSDGHQYIDQAIRNGAKTIICQQDVENKIDSVTYVIVSDTSKALGELASAFYDYPSKKLKLIGVTGTNGKTTCATILWQLFKNLGYKVGLFSTVKICIDETEQKTKHTTPDSVVLNRILAQMVYANCDFCFMEVSSHSIVQQRIAALKFAGGVFTNLTHEHLDYHKTFAEYLKAKKQFFDGLPKTAFAITNIDDKNGNIMLQNTVAQKNTFATKRMADFRARAIEMHIDGMLLDVDRTEIWTKITGHFNVSNLLVCYAVAILLGQDKTETLTAMSVLSSVRGRFETICSTHGITAIVDYAHTPDALQNVLDAINKLKGANNQVITVVGAGGNRDKTKRPEMGKIAVKNSSKTIFTSDNPRNESAKSIIEDMMQGLEREELRTILNIADRREAIKTAVLMAQKDDIILIAGKGHETYQEIEGERFPFDDKKIVQEMFGLFAD